jgi:archaellum component FlaC
MRNDIQSIPKDYDEVNDKLTSIIQDLTKLKDELNNNKDNVKKLYEIADKIENLQAELIAIKGFVMAQIYLNSEYNDE